MTAFAVWAPLAAGVELVLGEERVDATQGGDGWWHAQADAKPGDRYGWSLEGGPPRPDPRSVDQPDGIDGLSAVYDHDAFEWRDATWPGRRATAGVLYELHVGTFSPAGTFDGAIERLPHLVDLGIDAVEVMPVATGSGRWGWGYDGVLLYAVHPAYGGPDGFKRFVDSCHAAGIAVVLDVVYNHFGPAGNHLPEFGPYLTDRHRTFWGDAVRFDGPEAHEVRRFVIDNAMMWLRDFHCDGLRLDAVHAIVDESPRHVLAELGEEVDRLASELGRPLTLIAESDLNDPVFVRPRPHGYGLAASWADDWHHALHTVLTGERSGYYEDFGALDQLVKALGQAWVYDGAWSPRRGRPHGHAVDGLPADAFVVAAQNHDQVGNRAAGERLPALTTWGRLHVAAALLLTSPFVPMLFQGEEWGASTPFQYFTDHADPDLGDAVRNGRRQEFAAFGWAPEDVPDPQDPATFERSRLDWDEPRAPRHAGLLRWHRELLRLRRAEPDLHDPSVGAVASEEQGVVTVRRGSVSVVANLADEARTAAVGSGQRLLMASEQRIRLDGAEVVLPVDSVAILQRASDPPADG
jgi:maltooligosyltrehalose trehalohydrolase